MQKLNPKSDGRTTDFVTENIDKMKQMFPEIITEDGINFDTLRELLGDYVDDQEERYEFKWHGKSRARWIAQTPSMGTLRPSTKESVNWDDTQNLFIEGDNLEALKLLQKSYHKKVKMVYIDPPYNTGNEFIYPDKYQDNLDTYLRYTRQIDDEGFKISTNSETTGRYHTNWLNMMYPRLKLARNLMSDDGIIFISIDDHEVYNLRKICNEIFGEENFIAQLVWENKEGGGSSDSKYFRIKHEYILCYSKNISLCQINKEEQEEDSSYSYQDEFVEERGKYKLIKLNSFSIQYSKSLDYEIELPNGKIVTPSENGKRGCWRWSKDKLKWGIENKFIEYKENTDGELWVYTKQYFKVDNNGKKIKRSVPYRGIISRFSSTQATKQMEKIFENKIFNYPKPYDLIKFLIERVNTDRDIILDFFAGSSTTAHAVLDLNKEDNGNRNFIMVQLPESCDEESDSFKAGYETIADIGKERIRRVANKIKEENPEYQGDLGFKVFKLDSTNIKPWEIDADNLQSSLEDYVSNIKDGRSEEDVLYEILIKYGLDLTLPIEERVIQGRKVFVIGYGALVICLDDDITLESVEGIAKLKDELQPEVMRIVFKDNGFKDDVVKTNAVQILGQSGIEDVKSL